MNGTRPNQFHSCYERKVYATAMSIVPLPLSNVNDGIVTDDSKLHSVVKELSEVWNEKLRIDVGLSFRIGYKFNEERLWENRAKDYIVSRFGLNTYARWLEFARVARKWNPEQRRRFPGHTWTWYRNNNVSGPEPKGDEKTPPPIPNSSNFEPYEDGWLVTYQDGKKNGKKTIQVRIPREQSDKYIDIDT